MFKKSLCINDFSEEKVFFKKDCIYWFSTQSKSDYYCAKYVFYRPDSVDDLQCALLTYVEFNKHFLIEKQENPMSEILEQESITIPKHSLYGEKTETLKLDLQSLFNKEIKKIIIEF